MIVRRASSHLTTSSTSSTSSYGSSIKPPSALTDDYGTDEEEAMPPDDYLPSRPLSVAIPSVGAHGPYCPRRPNLREILANASPPPWTLAAFMAYLSNNHCLETLEFTMDAGRYKKHYAKMMSRASENGIPPMKDREYVQALWQRLVEAYIQPSGSREVNLPSNVRDPILNLKMSTLPPSPEQLDPAVAKIYELMEESVLVPFLNSAYPQTAHPTMSSYSYGTSDDNFPRSSRTLEDASLYSHRSKNRGSPQSHHSSPSPNFRQSAPVSLMGASQRQRFSAKLTPSTSSPATSMSPYEVAAEAPLITYGSSSSGPTMTDDSVSTTSPINDSSSTSPFSLSSSSDSPAHKRDSGMWKKLGRLSGMKPSSNKKKSSGGLKSDEE